MREDSFSDRVAILLVVITSTLGFAGAVYGCWGHWITTTEISLGLFLFAITGVGISVGFHRLFTHRSFECFSGVKWGLGIAGSMAAQGPLFYWVETHRIHHQSSDREGDPHSPHEYGSGIISIFRGWLHAHCGWMFRWRSERSSRTIPDLLRDPVAVRIDRYYLLWVALGLIGPGVAAAWLMGSLRGFFTGFLWGGLVRIFLVHHVTWSINSICHLFGTQRFHTGDQSRNNLLCALVSFGEGWHNNHHAFPNSARHGLRWWEIDPGYWLIRCFRLCGLAWNQREPTREQQQSKADHAL